MNNKITIGFPIMNRHELTVNFLKKLQENTSQIDEIIIIDNGSEIELPSYAPLAELDSSLLNKIKIIRHPKNIGVRDALNEIWKNSTSDYIFLTHNDVLILEKDWDIKVRKTFEKNKEAGVIGCFGSKQLGTEDIYKTSYQLIQLARGGNVSNAEMDKEVHGFRNLENDFENVIMFDGFCLIVKKELLDKINGFDINVLESHHMYDAFICLESLKNNYENIVIPLKFNHIGGQTDVSQDWASVFGKTKQEVHTDAHPKFYEYGKGFLPAVIQDIYDENLKICGYNLYMDNKLIKTKIYE